MWDTVVMSRTRRFFVILFLIGLLIRIAIIPAASGNDISSYAKWGHNTQTIGLASSFDGVYFPIQYLSFAAASFLAEHLDVSFDVVIKSFNLIFECGLLYLLVALTRKYLIPWKTVLLYWLNPFAIIIFAQGYIDAQFSFFVMLALWILVRCTDFRGYLYASIPIGIALLMKPQALPLIFGIAIVIAILFFIKDKDWKGLFGLFAASFVLISIFSIYFGFTLNINQHKTLTTISRQIQHIGTSPPINDFIANSMFLAAHYIHVPSIMPAINANMPNPWYLVAESRREGVMPIYRVVDTAKFGGLSFRLWGLLLFLATISYLSYRIARSDRHTANKVALVLLLIPILVPYLTTSAHENHFYLGFVTLIILGAWLKEHSLIAVGYILGILNALNLFYLYLAPRYWNITYSNAVGISIATTSSVIFLILLYCLFRTDYRSSKTS